MTMKKYKVGDKITVVRSGTRETISGIIKECFVNLFGFLAIIQTDNGERLITTETDSIK